MTQLQIFLSFITKDILSQSGFLSDVSHNRINNIVKNNINKILEERQITAIKHNTDLGLIGKNIVSVISTEDFNEQSLNEYFKEESVVSSSYKEIIAAIGEQIKTTKKQLNHIHTVGSSLIEKVNTLFKKYNTNPPGVVSYKEYSLSYEDWKDVGYLGPEDTIISELNKYLKKESSDISLSVYYNFISKIKNEIILTKELVSCILPEEKKEKIASAISSYSGLSIKSCKDMINIILDKNGIDKLFSSMEINEGLTVSKFNQLTDLLKKIHKFQNGYDKKVTSQTDKDLIVDNKMVTFNLSHLENVKKALIYVKSYYRHQHWSNFLILPTGKINNDLIEKAEANGIDKNTLRLFVSRTDFSTAKFFTIDTIKNQKENYLNAQIKAEDKKRYEFLKNEKGARQLAIQTVLKDYFTNKKIANAFDLSNAFAKETVNLNHPNEYGIYKAVLQYEETHEWTKEIFNNLGEELANLSSQASEITQRMIQEVHGNVISKKIGNFLIDNYC